MADFVGGGPALIILAWEGIV
ncbi:MAG: hypothetical protein RIS78_329, partial [Bacteroidota bacterium]